MDYNYQETVLKYINGNKYLTSFFHYYITHCNSQCIPYHNMKHSFQMMYHMINLYERQSENNIEISEYELLVLLTSALYHDFNHSSGIYTDDINIDNAIISYKQASNYVFTIYSNDKELQSQLNKDVCTCIISTEYPNTIDIHTKLGDIITEFDILSQVSPDVLTHTLCGLKHELRSKSWKDAISNYIEFISPLLNSMKLKYSNDYWKKYSDHFFNILTLTIKTLDING